ncbi:MAG: sigma 54-interacting transcriptional regulator [Planctomycetota bacterium]|jgi:hypothetical protein
MKTLGEIYGDQAESPASGQNGDAVQSFGELLRSDLGPIFGISHDLYHLKRVWIPDCARSRFHVLITGETGTGKELAAGCIHALCEGTRGNRLPFVRVSCSTLTGGDAEAELFGRTSSTYTNIETDTTGRIERAGEGTLLLDEFSLLPETLRTKILTMMERGEYTAVGSREAKPLRARIIATTADEDAIPQALRWRFPEHIHIPSLRSRRLDIFFIINGLLTAAEGGEVEWMITPPTLLNLLFRPWHGNAGELRNAVEMTIARYRGAADDAPRFFTCRGGSDEVDILSSPQSRYDLWYHLCRAVRESPRGRELMPNEPIRRSEIKDYSELRNLGKPDVLPCFTLAEALEFATLVYEQMEDETANYECAEARLYTLDASRPPLPPLLRWQYDGNGNARDEGGAIDFTGMTAAQAYAAYLEALRERCSTMNDAVERSGLSDTTLRRHFKENAIRQYKGKRKKAEG